MVRRLSRKPKKMASLQTPLHVKVVNVVPVSQAEVDIYHVLRPNSLFGHAFFRCCVIFAQYGGAASHADAAEMDASAQTLIIKTASYSNGAHQGHPSNPPYKGAR